MISFQTVVMLLAAAALSGQTRPRPIVPKGGAGALGTVDGAVASFEGVFKAVDKKFVTIQVDSGDIMRMYLTHGTKFVRDGKNVKAAEFHEGDPVTAEATRDVRMNLLAVRVETRKPAGKSGDKPEEKPDK